MSNILDPRRLKEIEDQAVERCMGIIQAVLDSMIVDGLTYGDVPLDTPDKRVEAQIAFEQQGIMEMLPVVNPKLARTLNAEFQNADERMIGLR